VWIEEIKKEGKKSEGFIELTCLYAYEFSKFDSGEFNDYFEEYLNLLNTNPESFKAFGFRGIGHCAFSLSSRDNVDGLWNKLEE
jgi:hypothetical protein